MDKPLVSIHMGEWKYGALIGMQSFIDLSPWTQRGMWSAGEKREVRVMWEVQFQVLTGGGQPVNLGNICHLEYRGGPHSNRPNQLVSSVLTGFLGYFFSNFYEYMWWFLHKEAFNQLAKMRLTGQMGWKLVVHLNVKN